MTSTGPFSQPNRFPDLLRRMDWARGVRAAVAVCAPLVVGDLAHVPGFGWAALGGFEAILSDQGGSYRARLSAIGTLSLGGAAGLFLGAIAGAHLAWALPATVLWCFAWSYLAVLGPPFGSASVLVQVIFICGIGAPAASGREALISALFLLAGGAWAAVLSLVLWPLDPARPARQAVAACYQELASFLASVAELADRPHQAATLWHRLASHHQYRIRRVVEQAWVAVAGLRASGQRETRVTRQLVVLVEHADLLIAVTIALAEYLESQADTGSPCLDLELAGLDDLRRAEVWIVESLKRRSPTQADAGAMHREMRAMPQQFEEKLCGGSPGERFLLAQLTEAASLLDGAIDSVALLRFGRPLNGELPRGPDLSTGHFGPVYARLAELRQGLSASRIVDQLAANFTRRSLLLRHAARVAIVCGIDVVIIFALNVNHGYWLLMTSLIVLQPHVSGTLRRGMERVGGTVGGGIVAAVLAVTLRSQLSIAAVLFPLAVLALAILPLSYAAFAFFLTPTFVLAWLPFAGDWQLAMTRIADTVGGALISIAAMLLLFPSYERERAQEFLLASLTADRLYLFQLATAWRGRSRSLRVLGQARRQTGLAHNDTEESLERLLAESWPRRLPFAEFVTVFVTYLRRFAQSVTTLAALQNEWEWKQSQEVQARLALLDRRMAWLEAGIVAIASPGPWPERQTDAPASTPVHQDHPGERQIVRLERQTEVLRRQLDSLRRRGWIPGAEKA